MVAKLIQSRRDLGVVDGIGGNLNPLIGSFSDERKGSGMTPEIFELARVQE
jgi:hypothetical protein